MGSIVAGLYAAGYSPAQMREIVESGEIQSWLTGKIDNSYGAYYREYRETPALMTLRLNPRNFLPESEEVVSKRNKGIDENVRKINKSVKGDLALKDNSSIPSMLYMPNSIMPSTQIDLALTRLFSPASESVGGDFSNLMVPFLCVASDLTSRQAMVIESGDLAEAIRASMAIPIAFEPIMKGDAMLYDGGIYDNFPWQHMQQIHKPDIMIGAICNEGNAKISNSSSIIDRIFALTTDESNYTLPEGNITIQRDVPVGMLDFERGGEIIDLGYHDTMEKMDSIKSAITARCDETFYAIRRANFASKIEPLLFEDYAISGLSSEQMLYVQDYLHSPQQKSGNRLQKEMTFAELEDNLYQVLSGGDFTTKFPQVIYNPSSGRYQFNINLETKPQLKLSLGGHLSSTAFNQLFLSLNYKSIGRVAQSYYTDFYIGPVSTSTIIGGRTDFFINRPLFLEYYASYSSKNLEYGDLGNITTATNSERVRTNDMHVSVATGMPISRRSMVSLRVNGGRANYYYDPLSVSSSQVIEQYSLYDRTRLNFAGAKLEYQRNTLNRSVYPQSGSKIEISAISMYGVERNYQTSFSRSSASEDIGHSWYGGRIKYQKYFEPPMDKWFSLGLSIDAVYTNLNKFGNPTATLLMMPSYQPVLHSKLIYMPDFSADAFIGAGVMPTFNLLPDLMLRTGFYGMYRNEYSVGGIDPELISARKMHYVGEAAFVYHASMGSVSLSFTKYEINNWNNLYLTFGFGFPLFTPKGIFY